MSMENLACIEIYRSNANIVHFTLFDPDDFIQDEEENEIDQL